MWWTYRLLSFISFHISHPLPSKRILDQTQYVKQLKRGLTTWVEENPSPEGSASSLLLRDGWRPLVSGTQFKNPGLDLRVSQVPSSAKALQSDHMPGLPLNTGYVTSFNPKLFSVSQVCSIWGPWQHLSLKKYLCWKVVPVNLTCS